MTTHRLKTWPEFFSALRSGAKTFDVRNNDRGFKVGDVLCLEEWFPMTKEYSGRFILRRVSYIMELKGVDLYFVVMGFEEAKQTLSDRVFCGSLADYAGEIFDRALYLEKRGAVSVIEDQLGRALVQILAGQELNAARTEELIQSTQMKGT